ncbi:MAG: Holliday junction resolvase RuvX, partial [Bacilli bacterium]
MGRMIGLDLGTRTLGIAMSDALGIIATGIETFRFLDGHYDAALQRVAELVKL